MSTTAIGLRDTTMNVGQVIVQLGGGKLASVLSPPDDLPSTVNATPGGFACHLMLTLY